MDAAKISNDKHIRPRLQVLISTIGSGIYRIAEAGHPRVQGVEYIVGWQQPDTDIPIPQSLAERSDFKVVILKSKGQGHNRRAIFKTATAPYILFGDDDLIYTTEELLGAISAFEDNPDADFLTFKYRSNEDIKAYPETAFDLDNPPRFYYVAMIELAVRNRVKEKGVTFNPHFGNSTFICGEDTLIVEEMLRKGLKGRFIPQFICTHNHASTGTRLTSAPRFIEAKGAIIAHIHYRTWLLRMLAHARRHSLNPIKFAGYCQSWLKGVAKARSLNVFTEDGERSELKN